MRGEESRVGWIVDAQVDFLSPTGRLYVKDLMDDADPGSVQILPSLTRAVAWMRTHCDVLVFTGDWHGLEDEEIDLEHPDPTRGTYPPHCLGRSEDPIERAGAEIIAEIRPKEPLVLSTDASDETARRIAIRAVTEKRPIFIHKNRFDVFSGNESTESLLSALADALGGRPHFIVVGVARDVCVTQAVDGLLARGYPVTAVSDALWGLGLEPEARTFARWTQRQGRVVTTDEL